MTTFLPQNQFLPNSVPARTSPGADAAVASSAPPLPGATANPFLNPVMPTAGSAVASNPPPVQDATAAPIPILAATRDARALALSSQAALANGFAPKEMLVTPSPPEAKPSMTNGGDQRAPAGSAPNTAAPAGADWEGRFWLVLDEVLAFPPIDLNPAPAFLIRDRVPGWV